MSAPFSLCVYCGSRPGRNPAYEKAARDLGQAIGAQGWRLVFGAGDIGLMGAVADAAGKAGAETLGIIPEHLLTREAPQGRAMQRIVTETMHERKKVMLMNADAVAVLPGGAGSLDEFFEVLTWAQLGLHTKPIYLVNVESYWSLLIQSIDHLIAEGFADDSLRVLFHVVSSIDKLVSDLSGLSARG